MPDCKACKETRQNVDLKKVEPVPYIAHEAEMARLERQHDKERDQLKGTINKLWIALIICIVGLIGMFIYEAQFETVTTTIEAEQESETGSNYAVGGDFTYGTAESTDYNETSNP